MRRREEKESCSYVGEGDLESVSVRLGVVCRLIGPELKTSRRLAGYKKRTVSSPILEAAHWWAVTGVLRFNCQVAKVSKQLALPERKWSRSEPPESLKEIGRFRSKILLRDAREVATVEDLILLPSGDAQSRWFVRRDEFQP